MRLTPRLLVLTSLLAAVVILNGCAPSQVSNGRNGAGALANVRVEAWTYGAEPARKVVTPHYVVYATVMNDTFLESVGQLMEGALAEYRRVAPGVPESDHPMECYLFATRAQWAHFTRERTGEDAAVYLQINRGGYTVRDWFVSYFLGDVDTFYVASHEGFHQFAARHFKTRVPPFLEEGLACMFENVSWDGRLPRWDLGNNYDRQAALRKTIEKGETLKLEDLATLHAGQIISRTTDQIGGFYAQCWGFARFLYDYNGGQYRPALQKMLSDAGDGTLYRGTPARFGLGFWDPRSAKPMLEHYLEHDLAELDQQYQQYLRKLANVNEAATGG